MPSLPTPNGPRRPSHRDVFTVFTPLSGCLARRRRRFAGCLQRRYVFFFFFLFGEGKREDERRGRGVDAAAGRPRRLAPRADGRVGVSLRTSGGEGRGSGGPPPRTRPKGGGHGDKYGEICCGCLCFSNPNLTLFALLFLSNAAGEGEAPAATWNTDGLGHEMWLRGGGKVCPRARIF